ncbi:alpha,alpha-trehalase TreA [Sphingomonas sp. So64.6b]|uniref:alpha,alpha-trehalase TreA n=1 Tax=Sphingomonas sp. So64.6b TaxID=2997354 RepID=UPI0015FEEB31|nr:alpha,alpha-trehalase TreA [Sphingomonas sp. So64.6b]QNA85390.1 alpha,alpha-trehalase TreA [Sphingomonas sp. So64.6b]
MMPAPPSRLFGTLFAAVQERRLFSDSKTFADAVPCRAPEAIMADWEAQPALDDAALTAFVATNFDLPPDVPSPPADARQLVDHIAALWPDLTRETPVAPAYSSALPLPRRYVVPGGRFRELYYWDSYFTMLGLARSGRQDLVEDMVANFGSLIEVYGHIPNGTRSYYLSRSHPPFFYLMAALSQDGATAARARRLGWMRAEHRFWMDGAEALAPGGTHRRAVRLADGALLNRYWDDADTPRDESWAEDVSLALGAPERIAPDLWRDLRAAAESGWDFSSRWLGDGYTLATIRTTRIVPVDLNSLLHGLESAIAEEAAALGNDELARAFDRAAQARAAAIDRHLWNAERGHYADHDLDRGGATDQPTAAMVFPLFAGLADPERAARTIDALGPLLAPWGLGTTALRTGQQWDAPNGWAPLQWIAVAGLRRYGRADLADGIAERWLSLVTRHYRTTGQLLEKYQVEIGAAGGGGEYEVETGFGWTNGVALEMLATRGSAPIPAQAGGAAAC